MNILRKNRKSNYKYNKRLFRRIILFIFSLIITTFAWVTYSKLLNDEMNIHIVSWDLEYLYDVNGDGILENIENPLEIDVPNLYPQMDNKEIDIIIKNNGESMVDLSCLLTQISILGQNYQIVSSAENATEENYIVIQPAIVNSTTNKSTQNIINDSERFPFTISIENDTVLESSAQVHLKVTISWEGINDVLDTQWGHNVAKYISETENPESVLKLLIQVNSVQVRPE